MASRSAKTSWIEIRYIDVETGEILVEVCEDLVD